LTWASARKRRRPKSRLLTEPPSQHFRPPPLDRCHQASRPPPSAIERGQGPLVLATARPTSLSRDFLPGVGSIRSVRSQSRRSAPIEREPNHCAVQPPSITSSLPVTNADS